MNRSFIRGTLIILLLSGILGLSFYGYHHPPEKDVLLTEIAEGQVARFQFFPLQIVSIFQDEVELKDREGNRALCVPLNGFEAHPVLSRAKRIDAYITFRNGECVLLASVDGSGRRLYKIIISLTTLFLVLYIFFIHYSFRLDRFIFDKRKNHA